MPPPLPCPDLRTRLPSWKNAPASVKPCGIRWMPGWTNDSLHESEVPMLWNYLREKVRESVLAGVSDALVELDGTGADGNADAVALLRARLTPALPAPSAED